MHKHDPRPPKHSSLEDQQVDDPLDSTTMPVARREGAPDKSSRKEHPKIHGGKHTPIQDDRKNANPGHGRSHLESNQKKAGGGAHGWLGPEKAGEREGRDELE